MPPNSQSVLDELRNFQGSRRKATDILKESETRLGLPQATQRQQGLRTAIANTENLIKAVEPSVSGRTGGSLVTEAQKTRLVGLERQPLDSAFSEQNKALEGESAMASELQRRALQESQLQLSEDDAKQNAMQGAYSMLYQREQDAVAKAERDRAFQEAQRQSAAQSSSLASLLGGNTGTLGAATTGFGKPTNPTDQDAYNDVRTRISGDDASIKSDYAATLASARNGNQRDKVKIQFYHALRPDLFRGGTPASAVLANNVSF